MKLEDIREVHSHPMAIQQCFDFWIMYNWKLVETEDTALSAKHIHQHKSKHIAAIASKLAAELYDLEMIAPNIHTLKNNYTRFLICKKRSMRSKLIDANKASINFILIIQEEAWQKCLQKLLKAELILSKLQSFPIPEQMANTFHADMEFETLEQFDNVIEYIKPITEDLKIYGVYKKGITE